MLLISHLNVKELQQSKVAQQKFTTIKIMENIITARVREIDLVMASAAYSAVEDSVIRIFYMYCS